MTDASWRTRALRFVLFVAFATLPVVVAGQEHDDVGAHADPVTPVVMALAIILAAAKLMGHLAAWLGQPAVLGELLAGVVLGSVDLAGIGWFQSIERDATIEIFARLGVVILLFEVGLESTVRDMLKVGWPALFVAFLGVVAPFALGWGVGAWLLPDRSSYVHAFLGATLTATSVGITARVLQDLNQSQSPEARIILGAAVIDDVLGLVILAAVGGVIAAVNAGGSPSYEAISIVLVKAVAFLVGSLVLGVYLSPRVFGLAARLRGRGVLLATALVFCFTLAYLASVIGLAPIVGAYAAGLILEGCTLPRLRGSRRTSTRTPCAPDFDVSGSSVLRRDGDARRSVGFRSVRRARPGCTADGGGNPREATVLARRAWSATGSPVDRYRHDPSRRGRSHLRKHRPEFDGCGATRNRRTHLFSGRHHGHRDDDGDTSCLEVEPGTACAKSLTRPDRGVQTSSFALSAY